MNISQDLHKSYNAVGNLTWKENDFLEKNLRISRELFTEDSLNIRKPLPRKFELYALLAGLPFQDEIIRKFVHIQSKIKEIIDNSLAYWVLPENFGLEIIVFKWPEMKWKNEYENIIIELIPNMISNIQVDFVGFQINPDGCIVLKGFDKENAVLKLRKKIKNSFTFIPEKQSSWVHVPIGRILEPVGKEKFNLLYDLINTNKSNHIAEVEINELKFIHEKRWYMENRQELFNFRV